MAMFADRSRDFKLWDYISGDVYAKHKQFKGLYNNSYGMSIDVNRYYYLYELHNQDSKFKIALKDPKNNVWSKWEPFPGKLWKIRKNEWGVTNSSLAAAIDVHRSVLPNEIVIESDYEKYEDNYNASKIIGAILENKGFVPHYYYSGNKSVHIHVFVDREFLRASRDYLEWRIPIMTGKREKKVMELFIEWLREKMISCWDTNAKQFDKNLVKATHLIRAELSKNKRGFKTFLGYTYKDMSFVPYICNEDNRIYPKISKVVESYPSNPIELLEEFVESIEKEKQKKLIQRKNTLTNWIGGKKTDDLRACVRAILSDDFSKVKDGFKRSMFILVSELRQAYGDEEARRIIKDWNQRMGNPVSEVDIEYRLKKKTYTLTCGFIHEFLKEIGFNVSKKCNGKI